MNFIRHVKIFPSVGDYCPSLARTLATKGFAPSGKYLLIGKLASSILLIAFSLSAAQAKEGSEPVERGFSANFRLEAPGLPPAKIQHELSYQGDRVESKMTGSALGVAGGDEHSYFLSQPDGLKPLFYTSSYGVFGLKKKYQIQPEDLDGGLDRQMMLYQLSQDALSGRCTETSPCRLAYLDHKARNKTIQYHQVEHPEPQDPTKKRYPVTLQVTEDADDEPLVMSFHPEYPGLIVEAQLLREGKAPYRLILNDVIYH